MATIASLIEDHIVSKAGRLTGDERDALRRQIAQAMPTIDRQVSHLRLLAARVASAMDVADPVDFLFLQIEKHFGFRNLTQWQRVEQFVAQRVEHACSPVTAVLPRALRDPVRDYYLGSYLDALAALYDLLQPVFRTDTYWNALGLCRNIVRAALQPDAPAAPRRRPVQRQERQQEAPRGLAWFVPLDEDSAAGAGVPAGPPDEEAAERRSANSPPHAPLVNAANDNADAAHEDNAAGAGAPAGQPDEEATGRRLADSPPHAPLVSAANDNADAAQGEERVMSSESVLLEQDKRTDDASVETQYETRMALESVSYRSSSTSRSSSGLLSIDDAGVEAQYEARMTRECVSRRSLTSSSSLSSSAASTVSLKVDTDEAETATPSVKSPPMGTAASDVEFQTPPTRAPSDQQAPRTAALRRTLQFQDDEADDDGGQSVPENSEVGGEAASREASVTRHLASFESRLASVNASGAQFRARVAELRDQVTDEEAPIRDLEREADALADQIALFEHEGRDMFDRLKRIRDEVKEVVDLRKQFQVARESLQEKTDRYREVEAEVAMLRRQVKRMELLEMVSDIEIGVRRLEEQATIMQRLVGAIRTQLVSGADGDDAGDVAAELAAVTSEHQTIVDQYVKLCDDLNELREKAGAQSSSPSS